MGGSFGLPIANNFPVEKKLVRKTKVRLSETIIISSDGDSIVKPSVETEAHVKADVDVLEARIAQLERENDNLRIHCEALQVRVRNASYGVPSEWTPAAHSTQHNIEFEN